MPHVLPFLLALVGCWPSSPSPEPAPAAPQEEPAAPIGAQIVPSEGLEADLAATQAFLDTRPTVERPLRVTGLEGVQGVGSLSAEACGACHTAIYEEWRASIHSQAWLDPQFQAEITKSDNRWLCLNCHTPLLVQHDRWPRALVGDDVEQPILTANPAYDAGLRDEGITCTACHLRGNVIHGPGLENSAAPHPVVADPAFRDGNPALCLACHQANQRYEGKGFVCTFDTGQEWRDGPYDDEGRSCVTCHMPAIDRPVAAGGPTRTVRRHWWRGAGIPKIEGRYPPSKANPPGLDLTATADGSTLTLVATNANAGHKLPSGDPERWVQIDARFLDAAGEPVGEPFQHRIQQEWDWSIPPTRVADNRLDPRESRTLTVPIPAQAAQIAVQASSHRISAENAAYHGLVDYPRSVVTHELTLPVRR